MRKFFIIASCIVCIALPHMLLANEDTVHLHIIGCNNNGICEPENGEDINNCSLDCTVVMPPPPPPPATSTPGTGTSVGNAPQTGGGGNGNAVTLLTLNNFSVVTTQTQATLSWNTNSTTITTISWGNTPQYEKGTISESMYLKDHVFSFQDLLAGSRYYYHIESKTQTGQINVREGEFSTAVYPDDTPPGNVIILEASSTKNALYLRWQNPTDSDLRNIQVLRNHAFYSADPTEGKLIYDGKGTSVSDRTVMRGNSYFYTIFAFDKGGNVSGGSGIEVKYDEQSNSSIVPIGTTSGLPSATAHISSSTLSLSDFSFFQNQVLINGDDGTISAVNSLPLIISINQEKIMDGETIVFNAGRGISTFFFKKNERENTYDAIIPLEKMSGVLPFTISTYNLAFQRQYEVEGLLRINSISSKIDISYWKKMAYLIRLFTPERIIILLLLIILICIVSWKYLVGKNTEKPL